MDKFGLVAQMVKHLFTMQETCIQSLGQEDPLEKEMATNSNTIAWKIPWMEEPDRLESMGSQRVEQDQATSLSLSLDLEYKMRHVNANRVFLREHACQRK